MYKYQMSHPLRHISIYGENRVWHEQIRTGNVSPSRTVNGWKQVRIRNQEDIIKQTCPFTTHNLRQLHFYEVNYARDLQMFFCCRWVALELNINRMAGVGFEYMCSPGTRNRSNHTTFAENFYVLTTTVSKIL